MPHPFRTRQGPALLLAVALAAAPLTGCSSSSRPATAAPASKAGGQGGGGEGTTATGAVGAGQVVRSDGSSWDLPRVPSYVVPGITAVQESSEDKTRAYHVRRLQIPGATALDTALTGTTKAALGAYLDELSEAADTAAELHVDTEVVGWSGSVAAARVTTVGPRGAKTGVGHVTVYGDRKGTWAARSVDLVEPGRRADLVKLVLDRLGPRAGGAEVRSPDSPDVALTDLTVLPGGGLRVVLDQGSVASLDAGTLHVELAADQVTPLLSARGREVVQALGTGPAAGTAEASPSSETALGPEGASTTPAPGSQAAPATDCAEARCVALTFDDGPGPYTERLLDELQAAGVRATFFTLGENVQAHRATVRRAVSLGMTVGNHTWDHRDLSRLDAAAQRDEIGRTDALLRDVTGGPAPLVRPPYGAFDATTRTLGHPLILWDVDTEDWKNRDARTTTQRALAGARAGSIILMHDIHPSTVDAIPGIVSQLKARGFTPVTVPELLGTPEPGKVYFRR